MALDIKQVALDEAKVVVQYGGEDVKVTYRPGMITTDTLERMTRTGQDAESEAAGFVGFFTTVLSGWDLLAGGKKLPLDEASVRLVPLTLLRAIYDDVLEDAGAGEAGGRSSAG